MSRRRCQGGHVALAFNMRTEHVPLVKSGMFSSRMFNIWMAGVVVFLAVALNVPMLQDYLQLSTVDAVPVLAVALVAFATTLWMEARKAFNWRRKASLGQGAC